MKLFIATTPDANDVREAAQKVVDRLNQRHKIEPDTQPFIRIVEEVGAEIGPIDALLIAGWLRFDGTDAGAESVRKRIEHLCSTWPADDPPRLLLYRCNRLPAQLDDIDGTQLEQIKQLFGTRDEKSGATVRSYLTADGLQYLLEEDLNRLQGPLLSARRSAEAIRARRSPQAQPAAEEGLERFLTEGEVYEVSFLALEIAEGAQILEEHSDQKEQAETLFRAFGRLVGETAKGYGGRVVDWDGHRGKVIFWRKRRQDHVVMTALKVLHNLPILNLDLEQNSLGLQLRVKAAAHDAFIVFRTPLSELDSADVNFLAHLLEERARPDELTVSKKLLGKLDPRLRHRFELQGHFRDEPTYSCRLPAQDVAPQQTTLDEFKSKLLHEFGTASSLLDAWASSREATVIDSISSAVDAAYGTLNQFAVRFSQLDRSWETGFLRSLSTIARDLQKHESSLWHKLRLRHAEQKVTEGGTGILEATVRSAARRRARPVVIVEKLERSAAAFAENQPAPERKPNADLLSHKVKALLGADDLDRETILTDLLMNHKAELTERLIAASPPSRKPILDTLWEVCDLVLLDDRYSIRGHQRSSDERLIQALGGDQVQDSRFQVVVRLLDDAEVGKDSIVADAFSQLGYEPSEEDEQTVWRCLVLAHDREAVRSVAAFRLTLESIWKALSHPTVPLTTVRDIAGRLKATDEGDNQKILFDCVRTHLAQAISNIRGQEDTRELTHLIRVLLELPALVETGYFERLDELVGSFLENTRELGVNVEYFERLRKTVEAAHAEAGDGPGKLPVGVKKLPLTLQRRFAGDPRYLLWFVTHPDPRIAGETVRNIGLANVEQVLRFREINGSVFNTLLRKQELFTRSSPLLLALNHPKCDLTFATRHIGVLRRSAQGKKTLQGISRNPSANPAVRSAAKRALGTGR